MLAGDHVAAVDELGVDAEQDGDAARKLVNVVLSGLPGELQDIRIQQSKTLEYVCDPLKWQQSKLSRMENAQQCISDVDLGTLFAVYGVTGNDRGYLLHMAERQERGRDRGSDLAMGGTLQG